MNLPSCQPVIFGPGITPHCQAAPWWSVYHITAANLGWYLLGLLLAAVVITQISEWIRDRWEITCGRPRITRRWYGTNAHVTLRAEAEADDPELYVVLQWDAEDAGVPSLKVHKLNPEFCTFWDEDSEAFWAPVTCFAPYTVRRFRPHFERLGPVFIPWFTRYLPLPALAVADGRSPAEINTAYYLNMAAWKRPYDPPGTLLPEGVHGAHAAELPGTPGRRLELMQVANTGQWALFLDCNRLDLSPAADMDNPAAREWASSALGYDAVWHNAVDAPDERCGYWVADPAEGVQHVA